MRLGRGDNFRAAIFYTMVAIGCDYAVAPAWYSASPLLAVMALLLLAGRRNDKKRDAKLPRAAPPISWQRLLAFAGLHASIILAGRHSAASLQFAALHYSVLTSATVAAKLIVLFPSLVLLPKHVWRDFALRFQCEVIAAVAVLFTFFPYRLFQLSYAYYSRLLGALVYHASLLCIPSLGYTTAPQPIILGPHLDVRIIFGCLGADGVTLFDCLFGLVMLVEWSRCNKFRALLSYAAGVATILAANALRIILMVLVGNLISARWVIQAHLNAGWLFFSFAFSVFMFFAYPFMLENQPRVAVVPLAPSNMLLQNHA